MSLNTMSFEITSIHIKYQLNTKRVLQLTWNKLLYAEKTDFNYIYNSILTPSMRLYLFIPGLEGL